MSRSRKKVCAGGICCGSNHEWYKVEHRRERRAVKQKLLVYQDDPLLPGSKEFGDPWMSPTDGKHIYYYEGEVKRGLVDKKTYRRWVRK
jgi:hypothetical protein